MAQHESLKQWAATVHLPSRPQWGQLETELLSRADKSKPGVLHVLVLVVTLGLVGLMYGSPWIGLAVVAGNVELGVPGSWGVSQIFFAMANLLPWVSLSSWRGDQRARDIGLLIKTGGTGVAGLTAFFYLWALPLDIYAGWTPWLALLAGGSGLGVFATMLVASKSIARKRVPPLIRMRTYISPVNELHYVEARNLGLKTLVENGRLRIDDEFREKAGRQPLGAWHRLDSST